MNNAVLAPVFAALLGVWLGHLLTKNRFRFETIHTERLETMKKVYAAIADLLQKSRYYIIASNNDEAYQQVRESWWELQKLLAHNRLFFKESTAQKIDTLIQSVSGPTYNAHEIFNRNSNDIEIRKEWHKTIMELYKDLSPEGQISLLQQEIETEFRQSL